MLSSKILLLFLVFGSCLIIANAGQQQKGWRDIVPLHSSRSDVERLLGRSEGQCDCIYRMDDNIVFIEYSVAPCKGNPPGWNVAADTVLSITIRSKKERRLSELNLKLEEYVKTQDDAFTTYYSSNDQGITYEVYQDGLISAVTYTPSISDNRLRCDGWPLLSIRQSSYRPRPFDDYSEITWSDESGRLDNFAIYLQEQPTVRAYVIVYVGRRGRADETKVKLDRVKHYLVNKRGIEAERIVTVDGGRRERWHVELFAIPREAPAPTPNPTIPPKK